MSEEWVEEARFGGVVQVSVRTTQGGAQVVGQGARTNLRAATSGKLFSFWEKYQPAQAPATVHTPRPCSKVPHQIENKREFRGEKRGLQLHNRSSKAWAKPTDSNDRASNPTLYRTSPE